MTALSMLSWIFTDSVVMRKCTGRRCARKDYI